MATLMVKDTNGYLNNRGKSKYWGVTTGQDSKGKNFWVVSFAATDLQQTVTIRPNFKIKENDAARVAAYIYEQGQSYKDIGSDFILSEDGKYAMHVNRVNRTIYRNPYKPSMDIYNQVGTRLDEFVDTTPAPQPKSSNLTDDQLFDMFMKLLDKMKFTSEQKLALVAKVSSK